ncbi:hypothetical protein CC85DRAFT_328259 [Cutaneotrichosporon oleaginosum]|uniref:Uncharacterized protein n=1 Tax=Cutaneotrichosporon oleaginosum TaxID=879819 RepID=A0A0J0XMM5_9TREE|nr:uncharacterized protein CC85DRAFT_328259 [Cutaneotrichosporon oleaginosum]KLT42361.1 hypothetical protein CC85DRAFT_328259 [Cutaneotrichosporon oleaginosum]TXT04181.1 hypothetical protein COLE_07878 [Cutaneotrichosporon oleaginosum]
MSKPHPYCRTDAHARTSLYFSRLRTWFRDRLLAWVTVAGSRPPTVARETEQDGHISGYLVYESVYDAELILATWETAVGVQFLDLRIAPDFPPPLVLPSPTAGPTTLPVPELRSPSVHGAPYFSQPYAATTPRRIVPAERAGEEGGESAEGEVGSGGADVDVDVQDVFRVMRVWGPVRTISIVSGCEEVREGVLEYSDGGEGPSPRKMGRGKRRAAEAATDADDTDDADADDANTNATNAPRKKRRTPWRVDVAFWYEEDADRLQREWDGVLAGWRADVSVPEWWSGLPTWADHAPRTPYCRPPTPVTS